jgi:hypothetical protein
LEVVPRRGLPFLHPAGNKTAWNPSQVTSASVSQGSTTNDYPMSRGGGSTRGRRPGTRAVDARRRHARARMRIMGWLKSVSIPLKVEVGD